MAADRILGMGVMWGGFGKVWYVLRRAVWCFGQVTFYNIFVIESYSKHNFKVITPYITVL
jgi:hypothetical protein